MNTSMQYQQATKSPLAHFAFDIPTSFAYTGMPSEASPSIVPSSITLPKKDNDHTKVDFKPFKRLKAKIDAITFTCHDHDTRPGRIMSLRQQVKDGTLCIPSSRYGKSRYGQPCLAIHDPSLRDLKVLVETFWKSKIMRIEFAIDAKLPDGSNDLWRFEELKGQLRHCLFPQRHQRLRKALRKRFVMSPRGYRKDGIGTPMADTQIIWESPDNSDQMALYVKTIDDGQSVGQPWLRMEARLQDAGPSKAGLDRMGMLPHFAKNLRGYLAPMFWIAAGYKNDDTLAGRGIPADPWQHWGAQWTAKGRTKLEPDCEANILIGTALNELRDSLGRIPIPMAVAHRYEEWIDELTY